MRRVRSTLLLRLQVSATVRNRSQVSAQVSASDRRGGNMAVLLASSAKVVTFASIKGRVASFRVAGLALCDISDFTVAIILRRCQKISYIFSWQAQHFGDIHRRFAWQAQHFRRVALRVL